MELLTRYFDFSDLRPDQSWSLLNWCRDNGGDEFTLLGLVCPEETERMKQFFAALQESALPPAPRRQLYARQGEEFIREVDLWRLTDSSIRLLQEALPKGFLTREVDLDLWLEDLTVYRSGEFMMGVVTHETGGVLRVSEQELCQLRATGFRDCDEHPWIGF